jgi:transcriptional regulator with XRE-family HTH domain
MDKQREVALAKKVGNAIADRRKLVALTQDDLAQKVGVGIEAISRMERGQIMPSITRLVEVADALECPVQDLLLVGSDRVMDYGINLTSKLGQLTTQDRDLVLDIVDKLASRLRNTP